MCEVGGGYSLLIPKVFCVGVGVKRERGEFEMGGFGMLLLYYRLAPS